MSNNEFEHELLKKLYLQKVDAMGKGDVQRLKELHIQHPELFDKKFLYNMLNKELALNNQKIPEEFHKLLEGIVNNIGILH